MKKKLAFLSLLGAGFAACAAEVPLFNGKDLSGWTAVLDYDVTGGYSAAEPTWSVSDGCIRTTGTPFGYLRTKRTDFGDFTFRVEYRWWRPTPKPNSGVFVRLTGETGTFIPVCFENQLCRGEAGNVFGLAGAVIAGVAPDTPYVAGDALSGIRKALRTAPEAEKPFGEWNTLEIEVRGDTLTSRLNGVEMNRVTGLVPRKGALALQSEGGAAEFRNLRLETLDSCEGGVCPVPAR